MMMLFAWIWLTTVPMPVQIGDGKPLPDLDVLGTTVTGVPASVLPGETLNLSFDVKNRGANAAPSATMAVYLSADISADIGDVLLENFSIPALQVNERLTVNATANIPASLADGLWHCVLVIDSDEAILESDENNNSAAVSFNGGSNAADLFVLNRATSGLPSMATSGQELSLSFEVINLGNGGAGRSYNHVHLSQDPTVSGDDVFLGGAHLGALTAGESRMVQAELTLPEHLSPGRWYLLISADGNHWVAESYETNNLRALSFSVGQPAANLVIDPITVSGVPASTLAQQSFPVTFSVKNRSTGSSGPNRTHLYMSRKPTYDATALTLKKITIPALNGFQSIEKTVTVSIPTGLDDGLWYMLIYADFADHVMEAKENDNIHKVSFYLGSQAANLKVRNNLSGLPEAVDPGQTYTLNFEIANFGNGQAGTSRTQVYYSEDPFLDSEDLLLDNKWTNGLAQNEFFQGTATITIPHDAMGGTRYIFAETDFHGEVSESNEGDNWRRLAVEVTRPDLVIAPGITGFPAHATPGTSFPVNFSVQNSGTFGAPATIAKVFLSEDTLLDATDLELSSLQVNSLAPNEISPFTTTLAIPAELMGGIYQVFFVADATNAVVELDETNNSQNHSLDIRQPDLVVPNTISVPDSVEPGVTFNITWEVLNQGEVIAPGNETRVYLSQDAVLNPSDFFLTSVAVPALSGGTRQSFTQSVSLPGQFTSETRFLFFVADYLDQVDESHESNNYRVRPLGIDRPDLAMQSTLNLSPTLVEPEDALTISFTLENSGNADAGAFQISYFLSKDDQFDPADILMSNQHFSGLIAGSSQQVGAELTVPGFATSAYQHVLVQVDSTGQIAESDESNNQATGNIEIHVPKPDLVLNGAVSGIPLAPQVGVPFNLQFELKNAGDRLAEGEDDIVVRAYLSEDKQFGDDILLVGRSVARLEPGQTANWNPPVTLPAGTATGDNYIFIRVDVLGAVAEGNENNNLTCIPITIPQPDLVTLPQMNLTIDNSPLHDYQFEFTMKNQGPVTAEGHIVRIVFSDQSGSGGSHQILASVTVPALMPAQTQSFSRTINIPQGTASGSYFLRVLVDPLDQVLESNEDNNLKYIHIPVGPDLIVSDWQHPRHIQPNSTIAMSYTIANDSGWDAGESTVLVYLSEDPVFGNDTLLSGGGSVIGSLGPHGSQTKMRNLVIPQVSDGTYFLLVRADKDDVVDESNESNNLGIAPIQIVSSGSDLVISQVSGVPTTVTAETPFSVTARVLNEAPLGNTPTETASTYRILLSRDQEVDDRDFLLFERPIASGLAPGDSVFTQPSVSVPAGSGLGTWHLLLVADADTDLTEMNEDNNLVALPITVTGNGPDLQFQPQAPGPPIKTDFTGVLNVEAVIENAGSSVAQASRVHAYLSGTPDLEGDQVPLGSPMGFPVPQLAPGNSYQIELSLLLPADPGIIGHPYLVIQADSEGVVPESDEHDNLEVIPLEITDKETFLTESIFIDFTEFGLIDDVPISDAYEDLGVFFSGAPHQVEAWRTETDVDPDFFTVPVSRARAGGSSGTAPIVSVPRGFSDFELLKYLDNQKSDERTRIFLRVFDGNGTRLANFPISSNNNSGTFGQSYVVFVRPGFTGTARSFLFRQYCLRGTPPMVVPCPSDISIKDIGFDAISINALPPAAELMVSEDPLTIVEGKEKSLEVSLTEFLDSGTNFRVEILDGSDPSIQIANGAGFGTSTTIFFASMDDAGPKTLTFRANEDTDDTPGEATVRITQISSLNSVYVDSLEFTVRALDNEGPQILVEEVTIEEGSTGLLRMRLSEAPSADTTFTIETTSQDNVNFTWVDNQPTINAGNYSQFQEIATINMQEDNSNAKNGVIRFEISKKTGHPDDVLAEAEAVVFEDDDDMLVEMVTRTNPDNPQSPGSTTPSGEFTIDTNSDASTWPELSAEAPADYEDDAPLWDIVLVDTGVGMDNIPEPSVLNLTSILTNPTRIESAIANGVPGSSPKAIITANFVQSGGHFLDFSRNQINISEGGATDSYTVVLANDPFSETVTVSLSFDETQLMVSPTSLSFTPGPNGTWQIPQNITVQAVDDALFEGPHAFPILHQASGGPYSGINGVVSAQITDNDVSQSLAIEVDRNPIQVYELENGRNFSRFRFRLTQKPNSPVMIGAELSNSTECLLSIFDPSPVTFSPSNEPGPTPWHEMVLQVDSEPGDINCSVQLTLSKVSGTPFIPDRTVAVNEIDSGGPAHFILTDGPPTEVAEGELGSLTVQLSKWPEDAPTGEVIEVSLDIDNPSTPSNPVGFFIANCIDGHPVTFSSSQLGPKTICFIANDENLHTQDFFGTFNLRKTSGPGALASLAFSSIGKNDDIRVTVASSNPDFGSVSSTIPGTGIVDIDFVNYTISAQPNDGYRLEEWVVTDVRSGDILTNVGIENPLENPTRVTAIPQSILEFTDQIRITAVLGVDLGPGVDDDLPAQGSYPTGEPQLVDCGFGPGGFSHLLNDGNTASPNRVSASQQILPHSGQEMYLANDLTIAGRDAATTLEITRRHTTRQNYPDSIFGPAWAFNYRQTFAQKPEENGRYIEVSSFGRVDVYERVGTTNSWQGTQGKFGLLQLDGTTATLRVPNGNRVVYHTIGSPDGSLIGLMTHFISPNNNQLEFTYLATDGALLNRRLTRIKESYGRDIEFYYGPGNSSPWVLELRDKTDPLATRIVTYSYDSEGRLLTCTQPAVTGTGFNDFPDGKTTRYAYVETTDPLLTNALSFVVYPNQEAGDGRYRLWWDYFRTGTFAGYVKSHDVGNQAAGAISAGGRFHYRYRTLNDGDDPNTANRLTTITDRRGVVTELKYNRQGQLLEEKVMASIRTDGPAEAYTRTFTYDPEGNLKETIDAKGIRYTETHPGAGTPRFLQATEIATRTFPAPGSPADQPFIATETIYEPIFNKPFKVIDPRGFEPGNNPEDFTTTYYYDYMEDLAAAKAIFAPQLGISESNLQVLLDGVNITDMGELNGDGSTSQHCGNLIQVVHPKVVLPIQADRVNLIADPDRTQHAVETYWFNDFGQLVRTIDAEGNVTRLKYFPAIDISGFNGRLPSDAIGAGGGYLAEKIADAVSHPDRNSGFNPAPVSQTTLFEYGAQNGWPRNARGHATGLVDPRGIKHLRFINQLDQVVGGKSAFAVPANQNLSPYGYESYTLFDANNQVIETQVQDKDALSGIDGFIINRYERDILDQIQNETLDVHGEAVATVFLYDESQNLFRTIRGVGSNTRVSDWVSYDERDLPINSTRSGLGVDATHSYEIDLNGNTVVTIDADGGDRTHFSFDGFDRLLEKTDRIGHRTLNGYDSASNLVTTSWFGRVDHLATDTDSLLAQSFTRYDARNRPFRTDHSLFFYAGKEIGNLDDGQLDPGDGFVSEVSIYDRLNRVVAVVDADDDLYETQFDGLSRQILKTDPKANTMAFSYDPADNLRIVTETEQSDLGDPAEVFVSESHYDALNRVYQQREPNGQLTSFIYDSRNNLIQKIDALGNQVEYRHDGLNRLLTTTTYLSSDGTQASSINFDPTLGGGDGKITITQTWDALHRLASQMDDSQNITTYLFDGLDRKERVDYPDNTYEIWLYNGDNELLSHRDQNGSWETWSHDPEGRPTALSVQKAPGILGTDHKAWGYDGLNRVTLAFDDNGGARDISVSYAYDSLSRVIRESQTIEGAPTLNMDREWQGSNRQVSTIFPNGRTILRDYDSLDRLTQISQSTGEFIATYQYIGPMRDLTQTYGNGTFLSKRSSTGQTISGQGAGYDSNRRPVSHHWETTSGITVSHYLSSYNGFPGTNNGLGTNRRILENRQHLGGAIDRYTFDSAYRMTRFNRDGSVSARVLDGTDKMTTFNDEGTNRFIQVDGDPSEAGMNQYSAVDNQSRFYDENANLVDDPELTYHYDYQNRLLVIREDGNDVVRYQYDAVGRRVLKTDHSVTPSLTTRYVYQDWQVAEERNLSGNGLLRQYITGRGLDEHVQMKDYGSPGEPVYYFHTNSQGSVGALTDGDGDVVEYYDYSMLGKPRILDGITQTEITTSLVDNPYMFQGRRFDEESGLYYFRNRYYNPDLGEFITLDPSGSWHHGQGNGYSAFNEDPWNHADPMGLETNFLTRASNVTKNLVFATDDLMAASVYGVAQAVQHPIQTSRAIVQGSKAYFGSVQDRHSVFIGGPAPVKSIKIMAGDFWNNLLTMDPYDLAAQIVLAAATLGASRYCNMLRFPKEVALPPGYQYRVVNNKIVVARKAGRKADLPALRLENGILHQGLAGGSRVSRNIAERTAFLKSLDASIYPASMRPYLTAGEVPPGHQVHHWRALFDGGEDVAGNMALLPTDMHIDIHRFYRPGGANPTMDPD